MADTMLDAALRYAKELKWLVFPLNGKLPRVAGGFKAATTDEEQIRRWWDKWPDANIGLATGALSGVVVLDIDGPEGEHALKVNGYEIPDTPICETGRGRHIYFAHPKEHFPNAVGLLPKVDVRGDGGYTIIEPSIHPGTGKTYLWAVDPFEEPFAPVPDWFDELRKGSSQSKQKAERTSDGKLLEGSRNHALYKMGCRLRGQNFGEAQILALLQLENDAKCEPPLELEEIKKIAGSAAGWDPNESEVPQQLSVTEIVDNAMGVMKSMGLVDEEMLATIKKKAEKSAAIQADKAKGETVEIELVRRTHGKGRGAVFDLMIFYNGRSAAVNGVSGADLASYKHMVGRAIEEGLMLPGYKTSAKQWRDHVQDAMDVGKVEGRDQDEDPTGAAMSFIADWIKNRQKGILEEVVAHPNTYILIEKGIAYFSSEALRAAISREIADCKRRHSTHAFRLLGVTRTQRRDDGGKFRQLRRVEISALEKVVEEFRANDDKKEPPSRPP